MKLPELCEEEGYVIRVHLCLLLSKIGLYRPEIVVPIIGLRIVRDLWANRSLHLPKIQRANDSHHMLSL